MRVRDPHKSYSGDVGRTSHRLMGWLGLSLFTLGLLLAFGLLAMGAFFALSDEPSRVRLSSGILAANLVLIGVLFGILFIRVASIFAGRSGQAAPILHRRFVIIFSVVALLPAMLVGAFSLSLVTQNIDELIAENNEGLDTARQVLNNYVGQEAQTLLPKAQLVGQVLLRDMDLLDSRIRLTAALGRVAAEQRVDSLYVLRGDGLVLARVESQRTPQLEVPDPSALDLVAIGQSAFQSRADLDYLVVISRLSDSRDIYLYTGDYLRENAGVLSSISSIEDSRGQLDAFATNSQLLRRTFLLTYIETAFLVLMVAVLIGTLLASRIIEPLGRLITASERIRAGDLSARVRVEDDWGEVSDLSGSFNRMTEQLSSQRSELIREHGIAEERRLFSEAVLSGVTAGVIGLSEEGRVTVVNSSAVELLGMEEGSLLGKPIYECLPPFSEVFRSARESLGRTAGDQVELSSLGETRSYDVRVSSYTGDLQVTGWVVTFDDMTRLVAAQRSSAWREVARRIAHEIKNPLTPIQLSAERLRKKFDGKFDDDPYAKDVLTNCTDTIVRAVGNLERMVDEFSTFARMPQPVFAPVDLSSLVRDVVEDQRVAFPEVRTEADVPAGMIVLADRRLLGQAIFNLAKNAAESVTSTMEVSDRAPRTGRVLIHVVRRDGSVDISVEDNGAGWPDIGRNRLLEPYVTTREDGTGLGLAIASRIAEDHDGQLRLGAAQAFTQGARVTITLPAFLSEVGAA